MGRDGNFACKGCKKNYYLGYGSYGTWLDYAKTVVEYDSLPDEKKQLIKNINYRKCLAKHEKHDWFTFSDEWCYEEGGNLYIEGGWGKLHLLCEGFSKFEKVDLDI